MKLPGEELSLLALRGVLVVACVLTLWWAGDRLVGLIQAPARLEAAQGNNAAFKAATEHQNANIDALQRDAAARKKRSEDAVNRAGGVQFKRAEEIQAAPAVGETDYERAVNRIDRELGLK